MGSTSTPIQKKKNDHEQHDVNVHLGNRLNEVKKDLFFKLNLPSSQQEEESSGRTATTASSSSTCMSSSEEEEQEEESFFGMETTKLSPRIMMFYQDDDEDDDDDDDDEEDMTMMNMAPSSASRLSFYHQEQKEEEEVDTPADVNQKAPSSVSNLSLLTGIALSLASPVSDETKDDNHDHDTNDDAYGIFLSFSEDDNDEHHYNES